MKRSTSVLISVVIGLTVVACATSSGVPAGQSAPVSPSALPSASPGSPSSRPAPSAAASAPTSVPSTAVTASPNSPAPDPTSSLAKFDCALPSSLPGTTDRAQIVDVRVGSHGAGPSGYDRMVIEFEGRGIPEVTLRAGKPPFTQDPSDLPLPVQGTSFLVLVLHGATAVTPDGTMTYSGPTDFTPAYPALTEFTEAGDFEAVSEWVVGLTGPSCHRLIVLTNPTRLVIDVQHP